MSSRERNVRHTDRLQRIGMIARWRPVHRGHAPVLRALCERASTALVGIGSSNRYNFRNPFTLEETTDMIRQVLAGRGEVRWSGGREVVGFSAGDLLLLPAALTGARTVCRTECTWLDVTIPKKV